MMLAHGAWGICPLELVMMLSSLPMIGLAVRGFWTMSPRKDDDDED